MILIKEKKDYDILMGFSEKIPFINEINLN